MASSLLRSSARVRVPSSSRPLCLRRPNMAARQWPDTSASPASTEEKHCAPCKYIALRSAPADPKRRAPAPPPYHDRVPGATCTTTGAPPPSLAGGALPSTVLTWVLCVVCHRRPFSALPSPPPLLPELAASHSEEQASAIGKARCADLDEWAAASGSRGLAVLDALAGARCVVDSLVGPPVSPRQRPPPDETPQTNGWHGRVQATSEQSGNDMCLRTTGRGVHHSSVRVQHRQFACS
ncbi:hypothetical protein DCS_08158 [Drechmeria coniospora]|uniref:Uncharacterized protein n=1 Tax=Drechmeria coniospora TaxID=98403 RepID=A0A151GGF8_DRECN|nr:hypothetical protein DCS_08158 [Drechmeria coniospora]KYK56190.1 hypothetical protein DCS_08158 [Drechmeria coniospora]